MAYDFSYHSYYRVRTPFPCTFAAWMKVFSTARDPERGKPLYSQWLRLFKVSDRVLEIRYGGNVIVTLHKEGYLTLGLTPRGRPCMFAASWYGTVLRVTVGPRNKSAHWLAYKGDGAYSELFPGQRFSIRTGKPIDTQNCPVEGPVDTEKMKSLTAKMRKLDKAVEVYIRIAGVEDFISKNLMAAMDGLAGRKGAKQIVRAIRKGDVLGLAQLAYMRQAGWSDKSQLNAAQERTVNALRMTPLLYGGGKIIGATSGRWRRDNPLRAPSCMYRAQVRELFRGGGKTYPRVRGTLKGKV